MQDTKIVGKMNVQADALASHFDGLILALGRAERSVANIEAQRMLDGVPAETIKDEIWEAAASVKMARESLTRFDKALTALIALRGELAEVTGISMFDHLTNGPWTRTETLLM